MKINIKLNPKSIEKAIMQIKKAKSSISTMVDELMYKSCVWIRNEANSNLDKSGLNAGFISELKEGWQEPIKQPDGSYLLSNHGRAYSVEFGIGIKGENTYKGDLAPNYEYNVRTRYKNKDGSWIFRVEDINTLDIKQENVMPRSKTGEVIYEEGRTIQTQGQEAVMFLFNALVDFKTNKIANNLWKEIKERRIG